MLGGQSVEPLLHEELLMHQLALLQFALEDGIVFDLLAQSISDLIHLQITREVSKSINKILSQINFDVMI